MKTIKLPLLLLLLLSSSLSYSQQHFGKSIGINKVFDAEDFKDNPDYEALKKIAKQATDRAANIITSYQQEYDYKFYRNYARTKKIPALQVISGKIISRKDKEFKDEYWFYNQHQKGDYFLEIYHEDTINKRSYMVMDMVLISEDLDSKISWQKNEKWLTDWLVATCTGYYNTSQRLNPQNKFMDTVVFSLDNVMENATDFSDDYTRELTDLINNSLVWRQTKPRMQEAESAFVRGLFFHQYRYLQNYLKEEKEKKPCKNIIFARLSQDKALGAYYLDIDLMIDGEIMPIPTDFDHRLIFEAKDKYSYEKVADYIHGRVGTLLWVYHESFIREFEEEE